MANHSAARKHVRQSSTRRIHNRYYAKTTRNAIRDLMKEEEKKVAEEKLPKVISMIDKLVKHNILHKNKASHLKSQVTKQVNTLA